MVASFLRCCCCRRWRPREYQTNPQPLHEQIFSIDESKLSNVSRLPYTINEQKLHAIEEPESNREYPTNSEPRLVPIVSEQEIDDDTENDESNTVQNYIINETENYYVRNDPSAVQYQPKHGQEILVLPGPTVTTINMAAERVTDDQPWERIDSTSTADNGNDGSTFKSTNNPSLAAAQMIIDNPALLLSQNIKYEAQPIIQTKSLEGKNKRGVRFHETFYGDANGNYSSVLSEMSGSDSESIYQTIRVVTRKQPLLSPMKDEGTYTVEIKDMTRSQNATSPSWYLRKRIEDISFVTSPD